MFGFKYVVLSPHYVPDEHIPLFNTVYKSWTETFKQVVESKGGKLDADDFFRFDAVGVLLHGQEIVGSHYYSLFDLRLDSSRDHHFIHAIDSSTLDALVNRSCPRILTLEYSNMHPKWRKHAQSTIWFEVLTGLGLKYMDQSAADGLLGTPRKDLKVDEMTYRLGAYEIQPHLTKMNYPCNVIWFDKREERHFDNPETETYVREIWKSHVDAVAVNPHQPYKQQASATISTTKKAS
jgi:hypothetical protein